MASLQITNPKRFIILIVIVLIIIGFGAKMVWGVNSIQKTGDITVNSGTSATAVGKLLQKEGYTNGIIPWRWALYTHRANNALQAGTYHIEIGDTLGALVDRMKKGETSNNELTVTYPEGFTLKQIAARTASRGLGTEQDFIAAAKVKNFSDQFTFLKGLPPEASLEGYLFPDTYRFLANDTPEDVIKKMLGTFDLKITPDIRAEATKQKRTLNQIVVMASIIEREVNNMADTPKVADVLWKRFDSDAGLGADATLRYILDKWDSPLTVQDLELDSPYNTRKYKGLPPGAIGNPGFAVILGALRPEKTDYYYYLSAPDGTTIFSRTNDEHNQNRAKYLR